jgi:hypothetical protein
MAISRRTKATTSLEMYQEVNVLESETYVCMYVCMYVRTYVRMYVRI